VYLHLQGAYFFILTTILLVMDSKALPSAARLALPSKEHAIFNLLAGAWHAKMRMIPAPGAPPVEASIECQRTLLIEGRASQEDLTGSLSGAPYHRIGILTYHRLLNKYQMFTSDNLDSGFMPYESLPFIFDENVNEPLTLFGQFVYAGAGQSIEGN